MTYNSLQVSSYIVTSEQASRILKARSRCLLNNLDLRLENVSKVIIVVLYSYNCALHIICQLSKDDYMDDDGIFEAGIRQE